MEFKFLYPYKQLEQYSQYPQKKDELWERIMISPYWNQISEWAGDSCDFMKPTAIQDEQIIIKQVELFKKLDLSTFEKVFKNIAKELPIEDEDPMTIAFYPSATNIDEGVFGSNVWGNIIICINPLTAKSFNLIPFVFAHEYHHVALGNYWYCQKEGKETKGNLLEKLINEGEADEFAKSLYPGWQPSWHKGVSLEDEQRVWEIFKSVLYDEISLKDLGHYMFGNKKLGIPPSAGYYFGSKIVKSFMEKYPDLSFKELIKVPHQTIFDKSSFSDR
ncbi:DUF2268 domain-containing putative Zn-dependent protease [Vallitalea okinawensis]|uniref:DUF2268 domain-containing putative Zn-dependent protease n=1 Tax=Vallitalea okinawensis TaxID=2078660 RepID=UPI000CFC0836|nr:DUF2268 domain-containing putative Zn-dependent protease [Vallitalea okinawensis]